MSNVTLFPTIKATRNGTHLPLLSVLESIKNGEWREPIAKCRYFFKEFGRQSKEYKNSKTALPYFTGSGTFETRNIKGLIDHSGFAIVDIDELEDIEEDRKRITLDKHVYSCFLSTSGEGLAVVMPINPDEHDIIFEYIEAYFLSKFSIQIDKLGDVSRARFISYDSDLYLYEKAQVFTTSSFVFQKNEKEYDTQSISPYDSIDEKIEFAEKVIQKDHKYQDGHRHNYIFQLASFCNKLGVPQSDVEGYVNATYPHFRTNPSNAISSPYSLYKSQYNTFPYTSKAEYKKKNGHKHNGSYNGVGTHQITPNGEIIHKYRYVFDLDKCEQDFSFIYKHERIDKRTGELIDEQIKLSVPDFCDWLNSELGFALYRAGESYIYIQSVGKIVSKTNKPAIKSAVDDRVKKYPPVRTLIRNNRTLLSAEGLEFLPDMTDEVKPRRDEKDACMLYYKNGVVKTTKDGSEFLTYDKIDWYVWDNEIIDREISFPLPKLDPKFSFFRYTMLVSGEQQQRQVALMMGLAYMIHSYKNPANSKVFFITDELARPDEPNGGSGKGILAQALGHVVSMEKENTMSMVINQFMYQKIKPHTRVMCLDEVTSDFHFRRLFSDITDGITVEKKGLDSETIPSEDAPKFLLLSNDRIKMDGGSFKRRIYKVELSGHFNADHTPLDEFGEVLFADWDKDKWMQFDTFILKCLHTYFLNDRELLTVDNEQSALIQLEFDTAREFVDFADHLDIDTEYNKTDQLKKYIDQMNLKKLSGRSFTQWLRKYAEYKGCEYIERAGTRNEYKIFCFRSSENAKISGYDPTGSNPWS